MNVTEAIHTQALLLWLTDRHQVGEAELESARESAGVLAAAARRRLGAGPSRSQVTAAWPDLLEGCAGCPACEPTGLVDDIAGDVVDQDGEQQSSRTPDLTDLVDGVYVVASGAVKGC